ncbi:NAD-dependent epimerase/dehydratase family protein [Roseospira navarrensis]|uniref:NAD-dependent epimerase/dehydratase family protein n=1 Tax=Roseospira navarrensis TaxID=140058 RepID=A0A7X2D5N5_9PROT|nr:NAD-dependent epimerase/dehydratase family protein [Roseospira navarrensis]MQX37420.1 NAD-dependent epimerase/dehydratase family protein [Roseospira navarrensis]
MSTPLTLVTGGTGFLGAALVRRLVADGERVRVLDNNWRGRPRRLGDAADAIDLVVADIRDPEAVKAATAGVDRVVHMSAVNGTRFFYEQPELVIDVAVRGILNVIDACRAHGVDDLVVASSSEAYQSPQQIPTPEDVPLVVPDVLNTRYSYGGSKLASELIALNYALEGPTRTIVFRPHNVYGPDMGWEHVIPEITSRAMQAIAAAPDDGPVPFEIHGDGQQTRAFIHVDDFTDGLLVAIRKGEPRNVYHIGNPDEVRIADLTRQVFAVFGREPDLRSRPAPAGETRRRCPDIAKLRALGFTPSVPLAQGLPPVVQWYRDHQDLRSSSA